MNKPKTISGFGRFYLWMLKAKSTMGIFYVAFVFLYLALGFFTASPAVTLDFFTAIQMLIACFLIGILQQEILQLEHLNRARSILWVISGALITVAFSLAFQWFAGFPLWCPIFFVAFIVVGMCAMLLSYYFELQKETKTLNEKLKEYQG